MVSAKAQTWNYVTNSGTAFILYGMSFPADQSTIGYACGMEYTYNADGVIVKTTDGGENWTQILPTTGTIDGLQGIWFIDELTGFAGGWNNYFIKTTDGGNTWTPTTCGTNVWYYTDIEFWDANNGVASAYMNSGSDPCIFITSDGGNSWIPASSGVTGAMMCVTYADATTLYAVHTDANVYKSIDGGHNWTIVNTLPALLFGCDFADANFGVVGGEEKIFATTDGGASWTTYTTGYENFYACKAFADGTAYVGGTDERIHKTTDFGSSWSLNNSGGSSHLYRIRSTPNGVMTACGSQGTILQAAPQLQAAFTADNTGVCEGDVVNFTDNSIGNIVSWSWTFEGGTPATSSLQNPSITYNTAGSYDVTLEVSDGSGTSTTTEIDYILVEALPAQAEMPAGPTEACGGNTYEYTTLVIPNADEYYWNVSPVEAGTIVGTGTTGTFTASTIWSGEYTVKVRGVNACGDGEYSPVLEASLYASPAMHFMAGGGDYCNSGTGVEVWLDGSEAGVNYELMLDGSGTGNIMSGTGDSLNFGYQTLEGFYTVTATSDYCSGIMGGQAYVGIIDTPGTAGIPEGPNMPCNNEESIYTTSGSQFADTLIWVLDPASAGMLVPTMNQLSIDWDEAFTGQAMLSVYGSNICGDGNPSQELSINVFLAPNPEITGPAIVCEGDLSDYSTIEVSGNTYTWDVDGGTIINGTGTHQITVEWGSYGFGYVQLNEANSDCADSTEHYMVQIDECTIISELNEEEIKIYPNPATSNLVIQCMALEIDNGFELLVHNMQGHMVEKVIVTAGKDHTELNVSEYPAGIYTLQMISGNKQYRKARFVVSR